MPIYADFAYFYAISSRFSSFYTFLSLSPTQKPWYSMGSPIVVSYYLYTKKLAFVGQIEKKTDFRFWFYIKNYIDYKKKVPFLFDAGKTQKITPSHIKILK